MNIKIRKPDDFHCHFRRGKLLTDLGHYTAQQFKRAVAMPNTTPPIETADDAEAYRKEIISACGCGFEPIMAIMLTRRTTPEIVREAGKRGAKVLKFIPRGVSTNSEDSVALEELQDFYPVLEEVQKSRMIFSGHWECLGNNLEDPLPDIAREMAALSYLAKLIGTFPELKIVVEHASTEQMVKFVWQCPVNAVSATLTVHHALITYSDVCNNEGRIMDPHLYCRPIAKKSRDVHAVVDAMISGNPKFFFGSDNAPHPIEAKKKVPPAAGIFNPFALLMLCWIFKEQNALGRLENFVSKFGVDFYGLPQNSETIELIEEDWIVPNEFCGVISSISGETLHWQIKD